LTERHVKENILFRRSGNPKKKIPMDKYNNDFRIVAFFEFSTPPREQDDLRCAGSGGGTPGCRRLLGASGQPGAACAPLGKQMPALEAPAQHRLRGCFSRIFYTPRITR
jgi:hypothetical protein